MSVATWNLNGRGRGTWDLLPRTGADVVLVQEARPPQGWRAPDDATSSPPLDSRGAWVSHAGRGWSSGIVLLDPTLSLHPCPAAPAAGTAKSPLGTLTAADVYRDETYVLTVASVYGMFQPIPGTGADDSYVTMNSVLDDLAPLLDRPNSRVLMGGDFNAWRHSPRLSQPYHSLFERLSGLGLSDCITASDSHAVSVMPGCCCGDGDACINVRTMRVRNQAESTPYQNDYLFASEGLLPALTAWEVQATDQMWAASDHCPVVVTLDLDRIAVPA